MRATRRVIGRGTDCWDFDWVTPPVCEFLEPRRLFAADVAPTREITDKIEKLALVHQELHRPPSAFVGDINRDGFDDVVYSTARRAADGGLDTGFDVYLNDGKGSLIFKSHTDCDDGDDITLAQPEIAVGDLDGDGAPDLAYKLFSVTGQPTPVGEAGSEQYKLTRFTGNGTGDFKQGETVALRHRPGAVGSPKPSFGDKLRIAIGDLDGDTRPDVASWVGDEVVIVRPGQGQTAFTVLFNPREYSTIVGTGDLDGDGRDDLVGVVDGNVAYATFDFASGGEAAAKVSKIDAFTVKQGVRVAVGDLDGDGLSDDLALLDTAGGAVALNDKLTFKFEAVEYPPGVVGSDILIGDVDRDGLDDLFTVLKTKHDTAKNSINNVR